MVLSLLPILAQAISLTAGDVSESRLRFDGLGQHVDLVTTGQVALQVDFRRTNWVLAYSPSIIQVNVGEADSAPMSQHMGNLAGTLRLSKRTTLTWSESAMYGRMNLRAQAVSGQQPVASNSGTSSGSVSSQPGSTATGSAPSNPVGGQPGSQVLAAPGNPTINYGAIASGAGIDYKLGKKWSARAFAGYTISGELDSQSPVVIPRARAIFGTESMAYELSKRDGVTFTSTDRYTLINPGAKAGVYTLNAGWNRIINRWSGMYLFAGESYFNSTDLTGKQSTGVLPLLGAALTLEKAYHSAGGLMITVGASVAPMTDYLTGATSEMAATNVTAKWTQDRLSFQVLEYGASSVGHYGYSALSAIYSISEIVTYQLDRRQHWSATMGSRQAEQVFSNGSPQQMLWTAFLGVAYTTAPIPM